MPEDDDIRNAIRDTKARLDELVAFRAIAIRWAEAAAVGVLTEEVALEEPGDNAELAKKLEAIDVLEDMQSLLAKGAEYRTEQIAITQERFTELARRLPLGDPDAEPPGGGERGAAERTLERVIRRLDVELRRPEQTTVVNDEIAVLWENVSLLQEYLEVPDDPGGTGLQPAVPQDPSNGPGGTETQTGAAPPAGTEALPTDTRPAPRDDSEPRDNAAPTTTEPPTDTPSDVVELLTGLTARPNPELPNTPDNDTLHAGPARQTQNVPELPAYPPRAGSNLPGIGGV